MEGNFLTMKLNGKSNFLSIKRIDATKLALVDTTYLQDISIE